MKNLDLLPSEAIIQVVSAASTDPEVIHVDPAWVESLGDDGVQAILKPLGYGPSIRLVCVE